MSTVESRLSRNSATVDTSTPLLDRTDWPVMLSVLAYGVRIGVRVSDPSLANDLGRHLPPGAQQVEFSDTERIYSLMLEESDSSGKPRGSAYRNATPLIRRSPIPAVLRSFEADLQLYVAEMAPEYVFVHAGVVSHRGRAILLPGRSFSGKTTLVAELVRAGAEYYSDEYAVLDSVGNVHPYARPLSIREKGRAGFTKCSVDTLGGQAGSGPLAVGLVVMSKFRAGRQWQPRRLSPGNGALALLGNAIAARRIPEIVMATLLQVVSVAPVIVSDRGEASDVVGSILEMVGTVPT